MNLFRKSIFNNGKAKQRNVFFAGFEYIGLNNLGDHIQSIAAEQYIGDVDIRVNRDTLTQVKLNNDHIIIMNGWFTHLPEKCFPPSSSITPVFWGFHVTDWNNSWDHFLSEKNLKYFSLHEPIGCRDRYTTDKLLNAGIDAFYSKCLTLTFPKRKKEPLDGWNVVVDVNICLPSFIYDEGLAISHGISYNASEQSKFSQARRILNFYHEKAKLVITSRVHCALSCIAMGIPIIFIGNSKDYRLSLVEDIGIPIYHFDHKVYLNSSQNDKRKTMELLWSEIDWNGHTVDLENEKKKLIRSFKDILIKKINSLH